jgi:lipopolysaccharide export system protein LptA
MNRFEESKILAIALVGIGLLAAATGSASAQKPPQAASPVTTSTNRTGSVRITRYERLRGKIDGSGMTLTGAKTVIEVTDRPSRSVLRFHADTVVTRKEGRDLLGQLDMTGNVRYTLTQQTNEGGERVVEGTAGRASYRSATRRIELEGGVQATLRDPARLDGPGSLKASRVLVDITATPYRYTIEGGGAGDIQFTPKENSPSGQGAARRMNVGSVHIYGYEAGEFQIGQTAQFRGANTTVEFANPMEKTRARFQASRLTAAFTGERAALSRAEAAGNVRYEVERPAPDGKSVQTLKGSSAHATYEAQGGAITLQGTVRADIADPDALAQPARVAADKVIATLGANGQPERYQITGASARTRLRFTPRSPAPATPPAGSAARPKVFPIGNVEIAAFETGTYAPGKSFEFRGDKTTFGTADKASRTRTQFQASHVVGTYADSRTLSHIEAKGNIRFHVEQPSVSVEPSGKVSQTMESLTGTGTRATFVNTTEPVAREVTVYGPLQVAVRSPANLSEPGLITGEADTTLRLNLAVTPYEFDIESPQQTAQIKFQPRSPEPETAGGKPKK